MAVREYVGARYVPRFVGTYDVTQIYDALDVVDNGAGTSYIARKTVPAGTSLTDTDYWFVYGASSGAIIQLQNDMIQVQNDIGTAQGDITNIQGDITNLQGDITSINNKLAAEALEIQKLGGGTKRIIMISDSYGAHPSVNGSWEKIVENYMSGTDCYSYYAGSMGFAHAGDGGYVAETLLAAHENDIPNHNTITDIIFGLGVNDYNESVSAVNTALNDLITYVRTQYPHATIWFGFVSWSGAITFSQKTRLIEHMRTMLDKCGSYGCKYINNVEYIMHDIRNQEADHVHPNATGAAFIAEAVLMSLRGATFHYKATLETTLTLTDGSPVAGMFYTIDDNACSVSIPAAASMNHLFSFSGGGFAQVGTIADPLFRNGFMSGIATILSNDSGAPAVLNVNTSGNALLAAWIKSGTNNINGMQINALTLSGATINV